MKRIRRTWIGLALGTCVALAALALFACSNNNPPQLPTSEAYWRNTSRIELVEMVVSDPVRAAKVKELYIEIETLMRDLANEQQSTLVELATPKHGELSDEEARSVLLGFAHAETAATRRYFQLQIELRKTLRASEFARLDAIK